jgi:hypothetical protein
VLHGKTIKYESLAVTDRGHLQDREILRISHFLDSRLTHRDEVVRRKHRSRSTPQIHVLRLSLLEAE